MLQVLRKKGYSFFRCAYEYLISCKIPVTDGIWTKGGQMRMYLLPFSEISKEILTWTLNLYVHMRRFTPVLLD